MYLEYIGYVYKEKGKTLEIYAVEDNTRYLFVYLRNTLKVDFRFSFVMQKKEKLDTYLTIYPVSRRYIKFTRDLFNRVRLIIKVNASDCNHNDMGF
jgi:hypothetical protein